MGFWPLRVGHVGGLASGPTGGRNDSRDGTRARQRTIALLHHTHCVSGGNDDGGRRDGGLALSMKAAVAPVTNAVNKSEMWDVMGRDGLEERRLKLSSAARNLRAAYLNTGRPERQCL